MIPFDTWDMQSMRWTTQMTLNYEKTQHNIDETTQMTLNYEKNTT